MPELLVRRRVLHVDFWSLNSLESKPGSLLRCAGRLQNSCTALPDRSRFEVGSDVHLLVGPGSVCYRLRVKDLVKGLMRRSLDAAPDSPHPLLHSVRVTTHQFALVVAFPD